ncbi:MAG: hypothetical protein JJT77_04310 [Crocinitomicaceae bacterium]|nr:hypothetical protein [Crocinitomicaceae bacterium]
MFYQARVGKKKALTDPVEIIPFVGQSDKKEAVATKKTVQNDAPPVRKSLYTEAKRLTAPTGQLKSSFLSINDLKEKNLQKGENEINQNLPTKPFSYDDLKMAWRKFAYKAKSAGMDTLFTTMNARDPILQENNVVLQNVENEIQKDFLTNNLTELTGFIRKELENYAIQVICEVNEDENAVKKLYTGQDKYNDMASRNPHLKTLKQRFKLDIEF